MAIKNSVSNNFLSTFDDSINVFYCHLPGVIFELTKMKQFDRGLNKLTMLPFHSFRKVILIQCHKEI